MSNIIEPLNPGDKIIFKKFDPGKNEFILYEGVIKSISKDGACIVTVSKKTG